MSPGSPPTGSQKLEQNWETPPRDAIPGISRDHVAALKVTDDEAVWCPNGQVLVILRTVGRKSGQAHEVALPVWWDPEGRRVVVASFAGAPTDPAWFLNLADTSANPEVLVTTREGPYWSEPEVLDGDEYRRIWDLLTTDRAWYLDYQARTDRRIPLVRLPESRPA